MHQQSSGEPGAQGRLGVSQRLRVEHLGGDAVFLIDTVFATDLLHLLIIGGHPERAALGVFHIGGSSPAICRHSSCE